MGLASSRCQGNAGYDRNTTPPLEEALIPSAIDRYVPSKEKKKKKQTSYMLDY